MQMFGPGKKGERMIFRQFLHDERSCTSYLIGCPIEGVAAVVDPQGDVSNYVSIAKRLGLRITDVLETHVHADHLSAARELAEAVDGTLRLGHGAEVGFEYEPLTDGQVLAIGNRRIRVIHTPGHSPEHVCLLVDDWALLTGDTLFVGDVGRIDLALNGLDEDQKRDRARQLYSSLQKLLDLPPETEVYPGHYAGSSCGHGMDGKTISTIAREKRANRALNLDLETFIEFQVFKSPRPPQDFERIKRANIGLDTSANGSDLGGDDTGVTR